MLETELSTMPAFNNTEVSEQHSQSSVINGRPRWAVEFRRFCNGIWQNFPQTTVGP